VAQSVLKGAAMKTTLVLVSLLFMACSPAPAPTSGEQRGTWKADTSTGSEATCAGHCGGRSPGRCYCDDACSGWGDCCPDYAPVCIAPPDMVPQDGGVLQSNPPDLAPVAYGDPSPIPSNVPDLSPIPSNAPDLSPIGVDMSAPQVNVQFSADITPDRNSHWPDAGATAPPVHIACTMTGSAVYAQIECGSNTATVNPSTGATGFMVYVAGGGLLSGNVLSPQSVELLSYSYTAVNSSYSDSWKGDLIVATGPIANVSLAFHGTLMVDRYDNHTGDRGQVAVGFSCTVKGPRNQVVVDCGGGYPSNSNLDAGSFSLTLPQPGAPVMGGILHGDSPVEINSYYFYTADFSDSVTGSQFFPYDAP
jgi:hypothetical protein